jgi:diguanylate cyclase (GGDEF)-like protein
MDLYKFTHYHATNRPSQHAQPPSPLHTFGSSRDSGEANVGSDITQKSLQRPHALIIDDDKSVTQMFALALQKIGFRCEQANSSKEALNKLAISEPDLVLLDLRIGREVDGEDILLQIRTNPRLDHTSVIVVSAFPEMEHLVAELADLVMVKPVEIEQLQRLSVRLISYRGEVDKMHINDPLTGLYNRNFFYKRLEQAMQRAKRRTDFIFGALALRVDAQDKPNGENGNGFSKFLLREVAGRLQPSLRPTDTTAFLHDKIFATLLEDLRYPHDIQVVIERIENKIIPPYQIQNKTVHLSYNLGAVIHDLRYPGPAELLQTTEETLQMAYETRKNCHLIVPEYGGAPLEQMAPLN